MEGLGSEGLLLWGLQSHGKRLLALHDLYPPRYLPRLHVESLEEGALLSGIISGFATPSESCT